MVWWVWAIILGRYAPSYKILGIGPIPHKILALRIVGIVHLHGGLEVGHKLADPHLRPYYL